MELFRQVNRQNRAGSVICNSLEDLGEIRNPEGRLKSRPNLFKSL